MIDWDDGSTTADRLASARGNTGDAKRYGLILDLISRLSAIGLPNAPLTTSMTVEDSQVIDLLLGIERRRRRNKRWFGRVKFRYDVPALNLSYGRRQTRACQRR